MNSPLIFYERLIRFLYFLFYRYDSIITKIAFALYKEDVYEEFINEYSYG